MRKLCLLWLAAFLLWSCGDSESTTSATNVFDLENSHLTKSSSSEEESSSSEVQSSSSSESDEDESYNSSTEENEESSSSDQKSSSSSKKAKSGSSKSKSKSSSSSNSKTKSSSSSNSITSSSSVASSNPAQTSSSSICISEVSPIHFLPLSAKPNANKSEFFFYGGADLEWPCIPRNTYPEPYFTNVHLDLIHVNELGITEGTPIRIQYTPPTLPTRTIDFAQMGVRINDPEKKQCGNFILYITVIASDDTTNLNKYVSRDSIEFVREPKYCEADAKSSSSAAIDSVVRKVEIRQFNGLMSTSETRGYSFKEDAEVPIERANIRVSMDELTGILTLNGVNGYKVVKYDNSMDRDYYDDWDAFYLPQSPVYTTDFKFTEAKLTDSTYFDVDAFWVVIGPAFNKETADDFYTITLKTREWINEDGVCPLKIIYYKK